ncbi:unnamed protein product [Leptosia nina]|uniref:Post-GPI attachment to proteins factor 3 n=1 Tax=Leptosia nina TaxID=320188 RepID=A0AAV1JTD7_9NEOP
MMLKLICLFTLITSARSSDGDRSPFYNKCVNSCKKSNCTAESEFKPHVANKLDVWSKLLLWSCEDDCRYNCMWKTVQGFEERGFSIPKFHGKWPFTKLMGIQEPASTFASILNLAVHAYMYNEMKQHFNDRSIPVVFWRTFAIVCMNAWLWSTIFHSRDNYFTEFMDYACALSMVTSLFVASVIRVFHQRRKMSALVLLATLVYYIEHVRYLYTGRIDYDYNMHVNIFFGVAGSIIWILWGVVQYVSGQRYTWRLLAFTLASGAALSLELLDFPPYYGWDAHALWHLTTVPLPLLFYRFVIDDLNYFKTSLPIEKRSLKIT